MNQRELRRELVKGFPRARQHLLPALHYVQQELGHLPEFALQVVGWHLRVPLSEAYGAATSYTGLRFEAPALFHGRVCTGLSCRLNGAGEVPGVSAERHAVWREAGRVGVRVHVRRGSSGHRR